MWPVLTPAELLHDLFGSRALLRLAASKWLTDDEWMAPAPPAAHQRSAGVVVGGRRRPARRGPRAARSPGQPRQPTAPRGEIRTYGHIVVDEVQDLTPMQLRMVARRSLNGSMTVVGRHRPGHRSVRAGRLERGAGPPARPPAGPRRRADHRLPHPGPDHGHGQPHPAGRGPADRAARGGAGGRCPARASGGWRPTSSAPAWSPRCARSRPISATPASPSSRRRRRSTPWWPRSSARACRSGWPAARGLDGRRHGGARRAGEGSGAGRGGAGRAGQGRGRGAPGTARALRGPDPGHPPAGHRPRTTRCPRPSSTPSEANAPVH